MRTEGARIGHGRRILRLREERNVPLKEAKWVLGRRNRNDSHNKGM